MDDAVTMGFFHVFTTKFEERKINKKENCWAFDSYCFFFFAPSDISWKTSRSRNEEKT